MNRFERTYKGVRIVVVTGDITQQEACPKGAVKVVLPQQSFSNKMSDS